MKKSIISLLLLSFCSLAAKENINYIDKTHTTLSDWIYNTSNKIDMFFSKSDMDVSKSKGTYANIYLDSLAQEHAGLQYNFNARIRLRLPRTQKKLHLIFENYKNTLSADRQNSPTIGKSVSSNSYLLGLQLDKIKSKFINIRFGGGVHFSGISPDAYISLYLSKYYYNHAKWKFGLSNNAKYFIKKHLDNTVALSASRIINENLKFSFQNSYHYLESSNHLNEVVNSLSLEQYIGHKKGLSYLLSIYSSGDRDNGFKLHYYLGEVSYKRYFYHDYAYYEFSPGIILRSENNFKPSAQIIFRIGLFFGKPDVVTYNKFK